MNLFHLSRIMGTSVAMIDATYGHLVPDSEEYLRGLSTATTRRRWPDEDSHGLPVPSQ